MSVRNSWARGSPRSNVSDMRKSHLASTFVGVRASCRLQPFGRVVPDCYSLSSVNSRQRVSALHSSVRLRLDYILLAFSSPELSSTPLTLRCRQIFRGLAGKRDSSRWSETRKRCPYGTLCVGPIRYASFLDSVTATQISAEAAEPFGLVILAGSNLLRLHSIKEPHSAGPTCPLECRCVVLLCEGQFQRWSYRPTTLQPSSVQRLPRRTGLPAHYFSQSSATADAVAKARLK